VIDSSMFVIVLTTFPADGDADAIARTLVAERLVACVNILPPMRSIYRWKGAVEEGGEHQLLMKTSAARVIALKKRLGELHPYEVPEMLVLSVADGAQLYLNWIEESVAQPSA
jgi:periplasmic divalent cation tolerance protein